MFQVLIIEDKVGRRIFPSVVAYKDNGGNRLKSPLKTTNIRLFSYRKSKNLACSCDRDNVSALSAGFSPSHSYPNPELTIRHVMISMTV